MSTQSKLMLGKWALFVSALALAWTGHLPAAATPLVVTMIAALAGVNAAARLSMGKVTSVADLVARVAKLEQSAEDGDGTTPPVAPRPAPSNVSSLVPKG